MWQNVVYGTARHINALQVEVACVEGADQVGQLCSADWQGSSEELLVSLVELSMSESNEIRHNGWMVFHLRSDMGIYFFPLINWEVELINGAEFFLECPHYDE